MRQSRSRHPTTYCVAIAAAIVVTLATSGCHWFSKKNDAYQMSAENRPLEVPPDLDRPATDSAMPTSDTVTQSVMRSQTGASAQAANTASGFTVRGERDDVFAKVGTILAGTQGLTIASKAQLLGTYDVAYQGSNFLVRITKVDSGVYVSAVDPRGMPATNDAATQLIAAIKAGLGG